MTDQKQEDKKAEEAAVKAAEAAEAEKAEAQKAEAEKTAALKAEADKVAAEEVEAQKVAEKSRLEHSEGGVTTRDDANDLGVPMLAGSAYEPQGPEDALGEGPKRGDYRDRLGGEGYRPHQGTTPQAPNAEDIGEVPGLKGGVETAK